MRFITFYRSLSRDYLDSLIIRFWKKVAKGDGCWEWKGALNSGGYGQIKVHRRTMSAHLVSYLLANGDQAEGTELDHLCRNRLCVRPDHLEPVTQKVNLLRGNAPAAVNARKNACLRGHPLSGTNLGIRPCGRRVCLQCNFEKNARRKFRATKGECEAAC
jgi:HNH endonuclease